MMKWYGWYLLALALAMLTLNGIYTKIWYVSLVMGLGQGAMIVEGYHWIKGRNIHMTRDELQEFNVQKMMRYFEKRGKK